MAGLGILRVAKQRERPAITEDGFSFEDRSYGSLSEIAREVTGAHWSGPRFFGLKRRNYGKAATRAQ